uniref:Acyl-[acyl-carrier-protein] hydrolase n=1 Tax=Nicotiana tabacum TaxID=4097 RepID=A0A1S4CA60_TOBAC|nr:PREDICTED: palmitoyl-acyl carrier protein thioesterase, chloroplastic-like isoform X2 [Nicotiana tabacum]
MIVSATTGTFFSVENHSPEFRESASRKLGGSLLFVANSKKSFSCSLQVKANSQAPPHVNGSNVCLKHDHRLNVDPFGPGKLMEDGFVFRQSFSIRSYEIEADRVASIEMMMNLLQETSLNHMKSIGFMGTGFGSTPEMSKRNLIWVVMKMQVSIDRYPTWGDAIKIDTWMAASGKNGTRRDWLVRDSNTGDILMRASSLWVMMNKETRKLSKIPDQVKTESEVTFVDLPPVLDGDSRKLPKLDEITADYTRTGLTPKWSDLDVNQHVNNVKYIGWILESAPMQDLEGYELVGMTLEYRRECRRDSVLQSLTSVLQNAVGNFANPSNVECQHLLRLESGEDVVKGRTEWRPRFANITKNWYMYF